MFLVLIGCKNKFVLCSVGLVLINCLRVLLFLNIKILIVVFELVLYLVRGVGVK